MSGTCLSNIACLTLATATDSSLIGLLHWIRPPMSLRGMWLSWIESARGGAGERCGGIRLVNATGAEVRSQSGEAIRVGRRRHRRRMRDAGGIGGADRL